MPEPSRQLAAIMFTDIVGYTALMQQDEEKAIQARNKHRRIFNSATEKHKGKILQYYGDGTLSIFDSAIAAVKCGIELQLGFQKDPAIPVRIGIHTGDIIFQARMQDLCRFYLQCPQVLERSVRHWKWHRLQLVFQHSSV